MRVDTNSWHYKLWEFTYIYRDNLPRQVNLCQYVRRIFLYTVLMGLFVAAVWLISHIVTVVAFLFGYGILVPMKEKDAPFHDITIRSISIPMGMPVSLLWVSAGAVVIAMAPYSNVGTFGNFALSVVVLVGIFAGLFFAYSSLQMVAMYIDSRRSVPRKQKNPGIIMAYLKAKKEGVCPLVTFENPPEKISPDNTKTA